MNQDKKSWIKHQFFRSLAGLVLLIDTACLFFTCQSSEADAAEANAWSIPGESWLTFMGNSRRTGSNSHTEGPEVGKKIWTFCGGVFKPPFAASPAVSGDRVYIGSDDCKLYCLDALTGELVWEFETVHEVFASPVVADGRVYSGEGLHYTDQAKLYCLDASTGDLLWSFQTSSHVEFSPTLFDGRIYFGAGEDGVYCLNADSGQELWQYKDVHVDMSPAVTEQGAFFGNVYGEASFYRLDPNDGRLIWKKPAPYGVCGSPSTDGKRVYFGLGNGTFDMSHAQPRGAVWCLSAADGEKVWEREVGDAVLTTVALSEDRAYFGSRDAHVYCVDASSGGVLWSFNADAPVLSSPAVAGGRVYFGSDSGLFYCLDAASGEGVWCYDTSEVSFSTETRIISSPAVANNRVYVGSMNSFFFCLGSLVPKSEK